MQNLFFLLSSLHLRGGGERVATLLANHFAASGRSVTLLSIAGADGKERFETDERVKIEYLHVDLERKFKLAAKISSLFALRKRMERVTEPTILLGTGNYPSLLAALLPANPHIRTIGCQHGSYASVKNGWKLMRALSFGRLSALVSLTQRDVPNLQRHNKNVWSIPNPLTFYPESPAGLENKLILAVGRLDYLKGYDLMLEMFGLFCLKEQEWQLRIVGDGPEKGRLEQTITRKGLSQRVSVIPATDKIREEYLNASVFLMTSRSEGLPMVLLEAQACGLPILTFDIETGPAEIVTNGLDGYLIKPFDIAGMSEKLLELCTDADQRKNLGKQARESVRRFQPEEIYASWEQLFASLDIP